MKKRKRPKTSTKVTSGRTSNKRSKLKPKSNDEEPVIKSDKSDHDQISEISKSSVSADVENNVDAIDSSAGAISNNIKEDINQEYKVTSELCVPCKSSSNPKSDSKLPPVPALDELPSSYDVELFKKAVASSQQMIEKNFNNFGTSRIKCIQFGSYEVETWHMSPYPEDISELHKIFICEFCLRYMKSATTLQYHMAKCNVYHPPGNEIYRKDKISVFEIDGNKHKAYCRNLCLLAKLFLDHKTLFHDVEPFLFYVMALYDTFGYHMIGYFSKEKRSECNYNLSCIMIMPQYMKHGYGKMLIDFSYLLSKLQDRCGSPERPLSDLGLLSYRSYWKNIILQHLQRYNKGEISLKEISQNTSIHTSDLISTLQSLDMLKYWKGMHLIHVKEEIMADYSRKYKYRPGVSIDPTALKWSPATCNS